ncbi:unnamed protein product [Effrenium voratum]|nr:unnamed protein product [Effrenium voratum]
MCAAFPGQSGRPNSSVIATTPLQELPPTYVSKAASLLGARDQLEEWLSQENSKTGLWRQGLDVPDVLSAVGEARCCEEEASNSPRTRYATQLLAQVIWEAELCEIEQRLPEPDPVSLPVRGKLSKPRDSRPQSAGPAQSRCVEAELLQRWEAKLETALQLKKKHRKEVEARAREKNHRKETVRAAHSRLLEEAEEERFSRWQERRKYHDNRTEVSKCAKQEVVELMMNASAVRQAVLETNRRRLSQKESEKQTQSVEQELKRQEVAEKKRQVALQEKGIGKPRLRIARELSKKQALRLERIRSIETEDLRQRLEAKSPTATPSVSPRPSRPSSAARTQVPVPPSSAPLARRPWCGKRTEAMSTETIPDPSCIPWPRCVEDKHPTLLHSSSGGCASGSLQGGCSPKITSAAEAEASAGTAPVDGFGGLLLWASEVAHGSRKSSLANVAQAAELGAHVEVGMLAVLMAGAAGSSSLQDAMPSAEPITEPLASGSPAPQPDEAPQRAGFAERVDLSCSACEEAAGDAGDAGSRTEHAQYQRQTNESAGTKPSQAEPTTGCESNFPTLEHHRDDHRKGVAEEARCCALPHPHAESSAGNAEGNVPHVAAGVDQNPNAQNLEAQCESKACAGVAEGSLVERQKQHLPIEPVHAASDVQARDSDEGRQAQEAHSARTNRSDPTPRSSSSSSSASWLRTKMENMKRRVLPRGAS